MTKIIVALDVPGLDDAIALVDQLVDHVDGFKVGLELMMGEGPTAITRVASYGLPVFADAKLHDIPNTVGRAAGRIGEAGARWVTVHASGGEEMMQAAVEGMGSGGVLAVTVLTSLTSEDLTATGVAKSAAEQVVDLGRLAADAGAEGLVCSPDELIALRDGGLRLSLFTPGIRPMGHAQDDQKRVATPETAAAAGADYLVIGRPITAAAHPAETAQKIASSLVPPHRPPHS